MGKTDEKKKNLGPGKISIKDVPGTTLCPKNYIYIQKKRKKEKPLCSLKVGVCFCDIFYSTFPRTKTTFCQVNYFLSFSLVLRSLFCFLTIFQ